MKSKDQQLLEEAYDEIAKMVAGSNNPGWDPERAFTSGQAFKGWEPKGGWPKKSSEDHKAGTPKAPKSVTPPKETKQSPAEVKSADSKVVSIPYETMFKIQDTNPALYNYITSVAYKVEENGDNIDFSFWAADAEDVENFLNNL